MTLQGGWVKHNRRGSNGGDSGYNFITDVASPVTVISGNQYDNIGAGGAVVYNLPSCVRELAVRFVVMVAQDVIITAAAGDQIHVDGKSTIVAGTVTSDTLYSVIELVGMNDTDWVAVASVGLWDVQEV